MVNVATSILNNDESKESNLVNVATSILNNNESKESNLVNIATSILNNDKSKEPNINNLLEISTEILKQINLTSIDSNQEVVDSLNEDKINNILKTKCNELNTPIKPASKILSLLNNSNNQFKKLLEYFRNITIRIQLPIPPPPPSPLPEDDCDEKPIPPEPIPTYNDDDVADIIITKEIDDNLSEPVLLKYAKDFEQFPTL